MKWVSTVRMRHGLSWLGVMVIMAMLRPAVPAAQSPISTAAKTGDRAAVRRLIAGKADVNAPAADGSTALLWAVYNSDIDMVRALLAAGAKTDVVNKYGMSPLLQASRTGDLPIIEALVKAGANAGMAHTDGETPLMAAARTGRVEAVRLLLTKGIDVNATDSLQNQSALMWAAAEGHTEVVNALLEAGAKPNLQAAVTKLTARSHADHPTGGFTALMWAARNGHEDVVKALAKGGADLKAKNGDGASATMIAIANDRLDIANLLLDLGADPNDGALYMAVDQHDATTDARAKDGGLLRWDHQNKTTTMDLIKRLLAMGADPNKAFVGQLHSISMANPENHNASAFFRAAVASDVEALKVLMPKSDLKWSPVAAGAGGRGGNAGRSALMVAAVGGKGMAFGGGPGFGRLADPIWREPGSRKPNDAVELLLKAGADPNFQLEDDGNTVLHQAVQRNDLDLIRLLARNKADLQIYNWTGQTPIDIAEENWDTEQKRVGPAPEVLQAMNAGTPIPEVKSAFPTVQLMRELLGYPALPQPAAKAPAAAPAR